MAKKKRKSNRKRSAKNRRANIGQKLLVGLAGVVLVLCAASVTSGFFLRRSADDSETAQFRIEILNGTGERGLAHTAKRELLLRGIDVIKVDNADHFEYNKSVLIARKKGADVELLGEIIKCDNVVKQLRHGTLEDATLILGSDYRELNLDWKHE
jgi:hypothetical protein